MSFTVSVFLKMSPQIRKTVTETLGFAEDTTPVLPDRGTLTQLLVKLTADNHAYNRKALDSLTDPAMLTVFTMSLCKDWLIVDSISIAYGYR